MLGYCILILNVILVVLNTIICSVLICVLGLIKSIFGQSSLARRITRLANRVMWLWATLNNVILNLFNTIEWQIEGVDNLSQQEWYLVISNHMSWRRGERRRGRWRKVEDKGREREGVGERK